MAMDVETKDCTQLTDSELAEMADMSAGGPAGYEIGLLSKQREGWVLVSRVRDGDKLAAYGFCTLERIGGTPALIVGLASVKRNSKREAALKGLLNDQLRRALLAFPDEDVLVASRMYTPGAFAAYKGLVDIIPRPDHKASGEERAWARRLAKRYGAEHRVDDRAFIIRGDGSPAGVFDHEILKPESVAADVAAFFAPLDVANGDSLVTFGWAMTEDLVARVGPGR